jgi:GWxTD domain-containing protein
MVQAQSTDAAQSTSPQEDPLQRPRVTKKRTDSKDSRWAKKWLDDVSPIITAQEEAAFRKLATDAERQSFVEIFWRHRDPTPDTEENEYKEEFYRRKAYADEHFSAGKPGSKTDRGLLYIIRGAPDSIDSHPGGPYMRPAEEGGGQTVAHPFEIWRYRHLEDIGDEVEIEFVDSCECGDYHFTLNRGEKDILLNVPNAGLTEPEAMGFSNKADRFRGIETIGQGFFSGNLQSKEFDRMEVAAKAFAPPPVDYKMPRVFEESFVMLRPNQLPFDIRVDYAKATAETALVPITIQVPNRALTYVMKDGMQHAALSVYGRLRTLSGTVTNGFEEPLQLNVAPESLENLTATTSLYQESLLVHPGRYRLDIVLKDVNSDKVGIYSRSITVPDFAVEDQLTASSLIVADLIEPVAARDIGSGRFVFGANRVRPRVPPSNGAPAVFLRGQKINLWLQVYNLAVDDVTRRPSTTIEYNLRNISTGKLVVLPAEDSSQVRTANGELTLVKHLEPLDPGVYDVSVTVNDLIARRLISPTARFEVK